MRRSLLALTAAVVLAVAPPPRRPPRATSSSSASPASTARERRELREDAGVKLVATLPLERTELVEPAPGDVRRGARRAARRRRRRLRRARPAGDREPHARRPLLRLALGPAQHRPVRRGPVRLARRRHRRAAGLGPEPSAPASPSPSSTPASTPTTWTSPASSPATPAEQATARPGVDDDDNGFVDDYHGWDFVTDDNLPQDGNGHGTHVAGHDRRRGRQRHRASSASPRRPKSCRCARSTTTAAAG